MLPSARAVLRERYHAGVFPFLDTAHTFADNGWRAHVARGARGGDDAAALCAAYVMDAQGMSLIEAVRLLAHACAQCSPPLPLLRSGASRREIVRFAARTGRLE